MGGMSTSKGSLSLRVPFDSLTLAAVVGELRPLLTGGQVQDIRQPEPTELLLIIRNHSKNLRLLLSADARFARVHLTEERKPNAPTPSAFCIALRRHIENGKILEVRQRAFDRVFEMDVQSVADDGEFVVHTLVAELMGKHSNLILVSDRRTVLEASKRISHRINRFRETLPGQPYLPPPAPAGKYDPERAPLETLEYLQGLSLEGATVASLAKTLQASITGMSPFLAQEIAFRTFRTDPPQHKSLLSAWSGTVVAVLNGTNHPSLLVQEAQRGAYPIKVLHLPVDQIVGAEPLNVKLDAAFLSQVANVGRESGFREIRGRLERELTKLEKQQGDVERTIAEGGRADDYQQQGELLLAHLWQIEPNLSHTTVQDFYSADQGTRTITLDPKLTAQENAQAYFRRAQKARDAQAQAESQVADLQRRIQGLYAAIEQVTKDEQNLSVSVEVVRDFQRRLIAGGVLREERADAEAQSTGPDFQGHKIRRYTTPEGYEIYCGETATANDFLTTRIASPNDLWLHVRASAGSHVIIRTKGQPDRVPPTVLRRAAVIAALNSNQKHSSLVPVDYTLRKYVRKPRGAAPGAVDFVREKTLHVSPQEESDRR